MAFTIGRYGAGSLVQLGALIATFYITALLFVVVVLGLIARLAGFSILHFLAYIREELLIVLGTSTSEPVLPQLMLEAAALGASRSVVGLVIPTGYSFNLDGTNIYMTLAILFLAQATNTDLSLGQQLHHPGCRHADLQGRQRRHRRGLRHPGRDADRGARHPHRRPGHACRHRPVHERMPRPDQSIGNGVATLVVARWENELDRDQLARELAAGPQVAAAPERDVRPELGPARAPAE